MKFLQVALMSVLLVGATSTLTSCKKDKCKDVTCQNGGTCADGVCSCPGGYEGTTCETQTRTKFLSSYNVTESCPSGNFSYQISINTSSTGVTSVNLTNFGGYNVTVSGTVSGSSLNIGTQQIDVQGTPATFSGNGQLSGNILTISYTIAAGGSSETCTMTCTKI